MSIDESGRVAVDAEAATPARPTHTITRGNAELAIRILDACTGLPVAGATMRLFDFADVDCDPRVVDDVDRALRAGASGTDGCAHMSSVSGGTWVVAARAQHYRTSYCVTTTRERERSVVDIRMEPLQVLRGAAIDAAGAPVVAASVVLAPAYGCDETDALSTTTRADGSFELDGICDGSWQLTITADGHPRLATSIEWSPELEQQALRWTVPSYGSIRGLVRSGGYPLAGAEVRIAADPREGPARAITSIDGTFAVDAVAPGIHFVEVAAGGERRASAVLVQSVVVSAAEPTRVEIDLLDGAGLSLSGEVRRGNTRASSGAVRAESRSLDSRAASLVEVAAIAADGSFRFASLPSGQYDLRVTAGFGDDALAECRTIHQLVDPADTFLVVEVPEASLHGTLLDAWTGRALGVVPLWLEQRTNGGWRVVREPADDRSTTALDGSFDFEGLAPGDYRVSWRSQSDGHDESAAFSVAAGDRQLLTTVLSECAPRRTLDESSCAR